MRSPISRLALVLIAATVAGPMASAAGSGQKAADAAPPKGSLVCVRTAKDARVILEVRVVLPSRDPAQDREAQKFVGVTIPPQVERDWVEWLSIWFGPTEFIDGKPVWQMLPGQPKIDCLRYKKGDPLPFRFPPGTFGR